MVNIRDISESCKRTSRGIYYREKIAEMAINKGVIEHPILRLEALNKAVFAILLS